MSGRAASPDSGAPPHNMQGSFSHMAGREFARVTGQEEVTWSGRKISYSRRWPSPRFALYTKSLVLYRAGVSSGRCGILHDNQWQSIPAPQTSLSLAVPNESWYFHRQPLPRASVIYVASAIEKPYDFRSSLPRIPSVISYRVRRSKSYRSLEVRLSSSQALSMPARPSYFVRPRESFVGPGSLLSDRVT